jgi:TolB-like protein
MAVFEEAMDAVETAIAITRELESVNADVPETHRLRFRLGLDRGEVSVTAGHYEGESLNVAARIQAIAPPGGLSVSGAMYRELDEPALRFRPTGAHTLKNIPEPVDVYEFSDLPSGESAAIVAEHVPMDVPKIVVLPIITDGLDRDALRLAGVVRSDILHRLSSIPGLDVVDAAKEGDDASPQQMGRYVLESLVTQFGTQVRINTSLLDTTTWNLVKAHKLTGDVEDGLALSDEVSEALGHAVEVDLVIGVPATLYAEIDDPVGIQHIYRGWYHLRSPTREDWEEAMASFEAVAESHPDLPYGPVLWAYAIFLGVTNGWLPETSLDDARSKAQWAKDNRDPTGMAQALLAAVLMMQGKVDAAAQTLEGLEIIRPTCDVTYGLEGSVKRYMGDFEEAADLMDVAMRLSLVNKPWYPTVKACSLFLGNRLEHAVAVAESVLEYEPHNIEALLVLAGAQVELGLERRARATGDRVREQFPTLDVDAWLDRNPYVNRAMLDRWRSDLASVGLVET